MSATKPHKRRKRRTPTTGSILERINKKKVTKRQLLEFSDRVHALPNDLRDWAGASFVAVRLAKKDHEKASALMFRKEALVRVVVGEEGGLPGWTLPKDPDGSISVHEEVLAAAAVEPLIEGADGRIAFDPESLRRRVLQLADLGRES